MNSEMNREMLLVREKVLAYREGGNIDRNVTNQPLNCCRKRKSSDMAPSGEKKSLKGENTSDARTISTKKGRFSWDPALRKFSMSNKAEHSEQSASPSGGAAGRTGREGTPPPPQVMHSSQPASPSGGAAGRTGREGTPPPPQLMHSTHNASTPNSAQIEELKSDESDEELLLAACEMNENTENQAEPEVNDEGEVPNETNDSVNASATADQSADPLEGSGNSVLLKAMDETRSACENY